MTSLNGKWIGSMSKPPGWKNESYRHALAARGIPTKIVDPEPAFLSYREKRTRSGDWEDRSVEDQWYWINEPDYEHGYDRYVLYIDLEGEQAVGEVSELKDGRWMAAPNPPSGPVEMFGTLQEAKQFVINYYSPMVIP